MIIAFEVLLGSGKGGVGKSITALLSLILIYLLVIKTLKIMVVKHDWQVQPILTLITLYHQDLKRPGKAFIAKELEEALNEAEENLRDRKQEFEYKGNERALLDNIVKQAKLSGLGGTMRHDRPQELMKAAATVYYDNTGEWNHNLYLDS